MDSETLFPQYVRAQDGTIYVDLPGLNDTRGSATAFINAVCIKDILTQAKSVKFIFTETQGGFEAERGKAFKDLLSTIFNLMINPDQLKNSSLFVLSKVNTIDLGTIVDDYIVNKVPREFYKIFPTNMDHKY